MVRPFKCWTKIDPHAGLHTSALQSLYSDSPVVRLVYDNRRKRPLSLLFSCFYKAHGGLQACRRAVSLSRSYTLSSSSPAAEDLPRTSRWWIIIFPRKDTAVNIYDCFLSWNECIEKLSFFIPLMLSFLFVIPVLSFFTFHTLHIFQEWKMLFFYLWPNVVKTCVLFSQSDFLCFRVIAAFQMCWSLFTAPPQPLAPPCSCLNNNNWPTRRSFIKFMFALRDAAGLFCLSGCLLFFSSLLPLTPSIMSFSASFRFSWPSRRAQYVLNTQTLSTLSVR